MRYWLVKSEPYEYSYQDLEQDGKTAWTGVRNYGARKNLREMRLGDLVLYYHSRKGLEIVGIAKVTREAYPDPTDETGNWTAVDLVPVKPFEKTVSLARIKEEPDLLHLPLVRVGRLSVMPIPERSFRQLLEMGNTEL
jgi:predicted RNA-binding protein with PUA-like domain